MAPVPVLHRQRAAVMLRYPNYFADTKFFVEVLRVNSGALWTADRDRYAVVDSWFSLAT
jgi:hypothetical protein